MKAAGSGLSCCTRSWPPQCKLLEQPFGWRVCGGKFPFPKSFSLIEERAWKLCVFGTHKDLFVHF